MKLAVLLIALLSVALSSCYIVEYYPDSSYYDAYPPRRVVYYAPVWDEVVDLAILGTAIWGLHHIDRGWRHHYGGGYRYSR